MIYAIYQLCLARLQPGDVKTLQKAFITDVETEPKKVSRSDNSVGRRPGILKIPYPTIPRIRFCIGCLVGLPLAISTGENKRQTARKGGTQSQGPAGGETMVAQLLLTVGADPGPSTNRDWATNRRAPVLTRRLTWEPKPGTPE
jgi:hypothetical protein